jgi:hypothetical protein
MTKHLLLLRFHRCRKLYVGGNESLVTHQVMLLSRAWLQGEIMCVGLCWDLGLCCAGGRMGVAKRLRQLGLRSRSSRRGSSQSIDEQSVRLHMNDLAKIVQSYKCEWNHLLTPHH